MDWNLKKMWPAAAASLVAFTSILNAVVDDSQVRNLENRVSTLEKTRGPGGMINPPGRPQVKDGYDIFVDAELLWWSVYENGLQYAVEGRNLRTRINNGDALDVGNAYSWGFRFGVGYNLPHDGWDLYGNWTFFNNRTSSNKRAPHEGGFFPIWMNPDADVVVPNTSGDDVYAEKASANWDVEFNIIDLELGREFFTSKYLTLRPHAGFRYLRLDQRFHADYSGGNFRRYGNTGSTSESEPYHVHNSNDMWGFGLRAGMDTQWGLSNGFSIFGNFAFALLHSHFHISQEEYFRNRTTRQRFESLDMNNRKRVGRATSDLAMGVRWDGMFDNDRFHLGVQFGWEHHMFWGQNQMWQFVDDTWQSKYSKGNDELSTQGWTLAARFDF